ncbi:MAG: 5'/3'-nucleotidase SurE [Bacteroidetes bacterium]|nr:5'/3'-nucleotidase SurE [Bacteroidota bacterium]
MSKDKLILVTNDDGVSAKGIHALAEVASRFGKVVVVAPDKPQSGMGHAITINHPLRLNKIDLFGEIEAYSCSGTPVDCVKLAIYEVLHRKPDLILSGVNHGENSSTNVLYSGTMSAAIEGAMEGISSIGFSLADYEPDADFSATKYYAALLIDKALNLEFSKGVCLNVNVPKLNQSEIKGFKICKQAHAFWADRFDKRLDQFGRTYFWLTGDFSDVDKRPDTDLHALKEGYISVVPTLYDLTAYNEITHFENWKL